jgi:hypothetical protein
MWTPAWSARPLRPRDGAADECQVRDASCRGSGVRIGDLQLSASRRVRHGQDLEKALAVKNTDIVRELSLPPCNPARCNKLLRTCREATLGGWSDFLIEDLV